MIYKQYIEKLISSNPKNLSHEDVQVLEFMGEYLEKRAASHKFGVISKNILDHEDFSTFDTFIQGFLRDDSEPLIEKDDPYYIRSKELWDLYNKEQVLH